METQENHTGVESALPEDQLTKVLVRGHEQSLVPICKLEDLIIRDSGTQLGDVDDFVAAGSERLDHLALHALITYEPQADFVEMG